MKRLLTSLAILSISGLVASPIITTLYGLKSNQKNATNNNSINDTNNYVPYQAQVTWEIIFIKIKHLSILLKISKE